MTDSFAVQVRDLRKTYPATAAAGEVEVLSNVTFTLMAGDSLAITGPSGSGKSTLLQILGTLDRPTSGQVEIGDDDPFALKDDQLAEFRNRRIGFIFQDHHLLPQYSVLENVLIPTLATKQLTSSPERAMELLERVDLSHRLEHRPAELSGGERQRVAVARAMINSPGLLLCDEPTGSLDHRTADAVTNLLMEIHRAEQTILVVVTHNLQLAERFERRFELEGGKCSER